MSTIFLSASVPDTEDSYTQFLTQTAVRELVIAAIHKHRIVCGGHPSILPIIKGVCDDLGVDYYKKVVVYQSSYFLGDDALIDQNVILMYAVNNDREESLSLMRKAMLSRKDLAAAVFIGGKSGIAEEYQIFKQYHPDKKVLLVGSTGGATRQLADELDVQQDTKTSVDYVTLFQTELLKDLKSNGMTKYIVALDLRFNPTFIQVCVDTDSQEKAVDIAIEKVEKYYAKYSINLRELVEKSVYELEDINAFEVEELKETDNLEDYCAIDESEFD